MYSEDFRRDAVDLVGSSGRTIRDVGRELGVNHETSPNESHTNLLWAAEMRATPPVTSTMPGRATVVPPVNK